MTSRNIGNNNHAPILVLSSWNYTIFNYVNVVGLDINPWEHILKKCYFALINIMNNIHVVPNIEVLSSFRIFVTLGN